MPRKPPPEDSPLYALGNLVKARRIARGLTQTELAHLCGVSTSLAQFWELGRREPGIQHLLRIAKRCDMALSQFLSPLDTFPVQFPPDAPTRTRKKPDADR